MTDENKESGVDPGASSASAAPKNKFAKLSMDQAFAEIDQLKVLVEEKDVLNKDLTEQLDEANKVLESQQKTRLISEILPRSTFKMDELVGRSIEDLLSIRATLNQAIPPRVNSVRFGVVGADVSDREKDLTIGDLSFSTAQKRKAAS